MRNSMLLMSGAVLACGLPMQAYAQDVAPAAGAPSTDAPAGSQAIPPSAPPSDAATSTTDESQNAGGLADIVVTATKRASNVQDVPLTVNVVDGTQLQKQSILSFQDVAQLTPGLSLTNQDGRQQQASIRGVQADLDSGTTSTVDIYLNETALAAATAFQSLYDIGQIEVVRGPQGTLRGQASPSGAILITTRRPSFDKVEGEEIATFTNNDVENFQAAAGVPLSDNLAIRIAGLYDHGDDADVRNITNGRQSGHETTSVRGTISWRPTDRLSIDAVYENIHTRTDQYFITFGDGYAGPLTLKDRKSLQEGPTTFLNKADLLTVNGKYDLGNDNRISYIGGYQKTHFNTQRDLDLTNVIPDFQYAQQIDIADKIFSHEVRFERTGHHFWNYMFGAYYSQDDSVAGINIPLAALVETLNGRQTIQGYFTNQTLNLTTHDTIQGGLRYSKTTQRTRTTSNFGPVPDTRSNYEALTGSASYQHFFDSGLMIYASYGRGYRPGGSNVDTTAPYLPQSIFNFKPEKSDSFEVGVKSEFLDRHLVINADIYNQTFNNFISHINGIACTGVPSAAGLAYGTADGTAGGAPCQINLTYNGDGISRGAELEIRAQLTPTWTAQFNGAYTDAHFRNATIPCNDYNGDGQVDINGPARVQPGQYISQCRYSGSLGNLPKWSFSATSEYSHPIGSLEGFVRGLVSYNGSYTRPDIGYHVGAYATVNAFVGLRSPANGLELTVFAKNLFNHQQATFYAPDYSLFGVPGTYGYGSLTNPRELGLTLKFSYGS